MDSAELDQWLDAEPSPPGRTATDPWSPEPTPGSPTVRERPRWMWLAAAAGVIWVAVMAVVFLGDADPDPAPDEGELLVGPDGVQTQVDPSTPMGPKESLPPTPPAAEEGVAQTSDGAVQNPDVAGPAEPEVMRAQWPPGIEAGAIAALRGRLTADGEVTSYLEMATTVGVSVVDDGVWFVVLDAIWLEGVAGDLSTVHRGRFGVPVSEEGQALAPPWPQSSPPPQQTTENAPPTGTVRLDDIGQVLTDHGWTDVTVVASDLHPFLTGVLVALVEGTAPGASVPGTEVLWLRDSGSGTLTMLGEQS